MKVDINKAGTNYTLLEAEEFPIWGITVPVKFKTDFASVPKFLWFVYPPTGYYQHAALLHDWLYVQHHLGQISKSRKEVDWIFREQMKTDGVGVATRWIFWVAVTLFGEYIWDRNEK